MLCVRLGGCVCARTYAIVRVLCVAMTMSVLLL